MTNISEYCSCQNCGIGVIGYFNQISPLPYLIKGRQSFRGGGSYPFSSNTCKALGFNIPINLTDLLVCFLLSYILRNLFPLDRFKLMLTPTHPTLSLVMASPAHVLSLIRSRSNSERASTKRPPAVVVLIPSWRFMMPIFRISRSSTNLDQVFQGSLSEPTAT